ncbi:fibronectin type III domain-containing protein [Tenacibaculum maritimum]|uniref:fibronectin type III domain-containing protein n=1 Tax=Tenacibaculum maritimum TaxID=107401 RepID=UPI0010A3F324|nr:fibronectin type III domain-containing protein [Tenacibaculum maritimum]QCD61592.1 hypothetical protein B9C57_03085 [Tenacibaculum maritimum]
MIKKQIFKITILCALILTGCDSQDDSTNEDITIPSLTTLNITNITIDTASSGGIIVNDGGSAITEKGIVWNIESNPTIDNSKLANEIDTEEYALVLTDLLPNTLYYVRAYAINEIGISYGDEVSFTTLEVTTTYEIGDIGPGGGYVFQIDSNGIHGKEVAPLSTEFQSQWGCPITSVTGTSSSVGSGQENSNLILDYHNSINYYNNPGQCTDVVRATGDVAAKNCDDLVFNGFNDWYLPSIGELELIYDNLISQNLGDIDDTLLSSSTQSLTNFRKFVTLNTRSGNTWDLDKNDLTNHRAVRNF